jgi:hypothetical protein
MTTLYSRAGRVSFGACGLAVGMIAAFFLHSRSPQTLASLKPRKVPALAMHTLANNERPLTAAERATLGAWLERWRACLTKSDIQLPPAKAIGNQLVLRLPSHVTQTQGTYLRVSLKCGDSLGGPPKGSSLVQRAGLLRLYRTKACLLPVKRSQ